MLVTQDPEMDLLAQNRPLWDIQKLDAAGFQRHYGTPKLDDVRFSTRTLIEGLIAFGILRPGDVPTLLPALAEHAVAPAFQDRLLESLYNEERIRNVRALISSERTLEGHADHAEKSAWLRHMPTPELGHLVMIRTVQVTPTRVLIGPPQPEPSNSVTRRYGDRLDGLIRVQFSDEEDRLHVCAWSHQATNNHRCKTTRNRQMRLVPLLVSWLASVERWQHGLVIGVRRFTPVASSASQQKCA